MACLRLAYKSRRPAAGRVDVIVIYKVDRLTRSLSDFSKIVDVLDAAKASFVSIIQAFNTTKCVKPATWHSPRLAIEARLPIEPRQPKA